MWWCSLVHANEPFVSPCLNGTGTERVKQRCSIISSAPESNVHIEKWLVRRDTTLGGWEKMSTTPQSLTPISTHIQTYIFHSLQEKGEVGLWKKERKSGSREDSEPKWWEAILCYRTAPHCNRCGSYGFFSGKLAEVVAVTAQSSAWDVRSAGEAEQMLLYSAGCSRQKCNKTAHILTQQVCCSVGTSMLHHDCSLSYGGRGSGLLWLLFLTCSSLHPCKWTPTIANSLTTTN